MNLRVGMPQMACHGLSENWLNRHCGDQFWDRLCGSLGVASADLVSAGGARLYPTFIAICGRYGGGMSEVRENATLDSEVRLARFGSSFFAGGVTLRGAGIELSQELLTAFVERIDPQRNDLRKSAPDPALPCSAEALVEAPSLLQRAQSVRKQTLDCYDLGGHPIRVRSEQVLFETRYEPSPYIDFNGADLLYFATYPTISDNAERAYLNRQGGPDWALRSSTCARDTYYLANLDLGDAVRVRVHSAEVVDGEQLLHTSIQRERDGQRMAEIFTLKALR